MDYKVKGFSEFKVGDAAWARRTITEADLINFAGVSGDFNPIHTDEEFAKETVFKGRIAHGAFTASFISNVLGNQLPGPGGIYVRQDLKFLAPVRVGDTITTRVEIIEKVAEKKRLILTTKCTNQEGKDVLAGEAELMILAD
ncbi:MAG: MaoC family dehydratase [Anaerolineales bacterium]